LLDWALVLVVVAAGQLDVWGPRLAGGHIAGPRPVVSACYLATALALGWRRRHPLAVWFFVAGLDIVQWLWLGASAGNGTLVPGLVAGYSVGAFCGLPVAYLGVIGALPVSLVHELTNPNLPTGRAVLRGVAWDLTFVGAWLLGAYVRTRRLYVAELRERAARAELEREERAAAAVADERARIARELHDAIAHGVSVMVVQAEAAEEVLDADPVAARGALRKVQRSGRVALGELRRLVGVLRADDARLQLVPQPGLSSLDRLVAEVRESGFPVGFRVEGEARHLPPGIDLSAYRIVQEALTNVIKHAGPARAEVLVAYRDGLLLLEVADDGAGPAATNGGGHGLAGMRERVALYGGELEAGARDGGGFLVCARLPVSPR
jgi:signal transduction histidine kinase